MPLDDDRPVTLWAACNWLVCDDRLAANAIEMVRRMAAHCVLQNGLGVSLQRIPLPRGEQRRWICKGLVFWKGTQACLGEGVQTGSPRPCARQGQRPI